MHVDMHAWEESNIGSWWDQKGTCTCLRPRCFWQSKIHVWEIVGPRNGKKRVYSIEKLLYMSGVYWIEKLVYLFDIGACLIIHTFQLIF